MRNSRILKDIKFITACKESDMSYAVVFLKKKYQNAKPFGRTLKPGLTSTETKQDLNHQCGLIQQFHLTWQTGQTIHWRDDRRLNSNFAFPKPNIFTLIAILEKEYRYYSQIMDKIRKHKEPKSIHKPLMLPTLPRVFVLFMKRKKVNYIK